MIESRIDFELDQRAAGFKQRALAMVIDFLLLAGYAVILFLVTTLLISITNIEQQMTSAIRRDFVAFITLVLPVILYFTLQESSARQATIGKRKMGLKVVANHGEKLSTGRALLRSVIKFLPWQMAHTAVFQLSAGNTSPFFLALSILAQVLVIAFLLLIWLDRRHRAPYDWIADSYVVYRRQGET